MSRRVFARSIALCQSGSAEVSLFSFRTASAVDSPESGASQILIIPYVVRAKWNSLRLSLFIGSLFWPRRCRTSNTRFPRATTTEQWQRVVLFVFKSRGNCRERTPAKARQPLEESIGVLGKLDEPEQCRVWSGVRAILIRI